MGLWPIQWYGDFFHISIFSRDHKNSINGKYGPSRSQTTLISYLNQIMWHKIAIIISILVIILSPSHNAKVTWSVLKWNFLLPHRRSGFPFLRFFVSQLEPTRNSTPTYNSVIQIHHLSNFPEVQCFGRISGTYFGNIGSFQRKYQQWKKAKKKGAFFTTIHQSQWIMKFLVWTVLPVGHWSVCQCIRPVLPLVQTSTADKVYAYQQPNKGATKWRPNYNCCAQLVRVQTAWKNNNETRTLSSLCHWCN